MTPEETAAWRADGAREARDGRRNVVREFLETMRPEDDAALRASAASDAADDEENLQQIFALLDRGAVLDGSPEDIARVTEAWQRARAAADGRPSDT